MGSVDRELIDVLMQFHREVVVPDIRRIVGEAVGVIDLKLTSFRNETLSNFDAVYTRFDRLESEYGALSAAVKRIEQRQT